MSPVSAKRQFAQLLAHIEAEPDYTLNLNSTRSRPTPRVVATYEPAELARELGYTNEHRAGKVVRDYLRKKYPGHPKYQRWVLDEVQAADVRVNVPRKR